MSLASDSHPERNDDKVMGMPDNRIRPYTEKTAKKLERAEKNERAMENHLYKLNVHAVLDGVSLGRGDAASRIAAGELAGRMGLMGDKASVEETVQAMQEGLEQADLECTDSKSYTTADLIRIMPCADGEPTTVVYAHVGDGRIYRRTADGKLDRMTSDQNEYNDTIDWEVAKGKLSVEQAERYRRARHLRDIKDAPDVVKTAFGKQHVVTSALGGCLRPQVGTFELMPGDSVVMVTDGVHDNLPDEDIGAAIDANPADPAYAISQAARKRSTEYWRGDVKGPDDITAVVIGYPET